MNFIAGNGGGYDFRLIGTEGEMQVGSNSVKLIRSKLGMLPTEYALIAYTEENQKKIIAAYDQKFPGDRSSDLTIGESNYEAEVLLSSSDLNANPLAIELQAKLEKYAQKLTEVLGTHILFSAGA